MVEGEGQGKQWGKERKVGNGEGIRDILFSDPNPAGSTFQQNFIVLRGKKKKNFTVIFAN